MRPLSHEITGHDVEASPTTGRDVDYLSVSKEHENQVAASYRTPIWWLKPNVLSSASTTHDLDRRQREVEDGYTVRTTLDKSGSEEGVLESEICLDTVVHDMPSKLAIDVNF
jgi:hypothetical protein